ncbi:helix-turn-helix protein [Vagococcus fluvialis]|uniref:Transcriptional regulator n=1 Tax=Vagococcus fluvialis TaxID=2738 RepID=A0A369B436_9ENTE|nr:helix-turn-helix transcriptional regulator [Vagococcus fluvialis]RCX15297.1 helix-turn-helix protein [Vagococcus fluvialis]RSU05433.1 transcriptional regulator [Vagococcus fluvialis]UDM70704.1 helix-turn-helix transcriptional regulator [Vagococcus fluvialis]UDM74951.1 helix-turn-helix transcriptional regulator [Vagococcus fluvialis]UDM78123.1 helix-turn-helix transcriptional regulator [Vagococcus fluvialis]
MSENLDLQIRNELRKRKMTLSELASLVGISSPYLSDILNGKRDGQKAQEHINSIKKILNIKSKQEV